MTYRKQNFVDDQILTADHLNHIEDGIVAIESDMKDLTLGLHTDGLLYIFKDGEPIGNGIAMIGGETGDVIGNVDSANNIILYGNLQEGAYSVQYELEDGSLVTVGTLNIDDSEDPEDPVELVNLLPLSIDENGNDFVGENGEDGYITGHRLNSSAQLIAFAESGGACTTGFMPATLYDTIRIINITQFPDSQRGIDKVIYYDSSKVKIGHTTLVKENTTIEIEEGDVYKFSPSATLSGDVQYFRICTGVINENTIITVNQKIPSDYAVEPEEPGEDTDEGVNYFDISTITLNSRLNSGGNESTYNGMFITDYIPVNVNMEKQVFKISGIDLVLSTNYKYCSRIIWYNSDKTMVAANNATELDEWSYMQPCFRGAGSENVDTSIAYVRISYVVKDNVEITADDVKNVVITTMDYYK